MPNRLEELVAGWQDRALARAEQRELLELVHASEESARVATHDRLIDRWLHESRRVPLNPELILGAIAESPSPVAGRTMAELKRRESEEAPGGQSEVKLWTWFSTPRIRLAALGGVIVLLVLGVWLYAGPLFAPRIEIGQFATVTGEPTIQHYRHKAQHKASRLTAVYLGDRIQTADADKAELRFRDGTRLTLNFNTTIEIPSPKSKVQSPKSLLRPTEVKLVVGQVWAKVQKLTNAPQFEAQTPVATATAKGTEFGLKLQKTKPAKPDNQNPNPGSALLAVLTVREGTVEFSNAYGTVDATAMTESQATADSAPREPQRVDALKVFRLNRTGLIVINRKLSLQSQPEWLVSPIGWIGVTMASVATDEPAGAPASQHPKVVRISAVRSGSPASLAGVQVGDVISAVNGQTATNTSQVRAAIVTSFNRQLTLNLKRTNQERSVALVPTFTPDAPPLPAVPAQLRNALFEATAQVIAAAFQDRIAPDHFTEGELALEQLLRTYPDVAALHNNIAVVHESKEQLGEAIRHYQRAVELAPQVALYHLHLGTALRSIGNLERSAEELEQAALLAPAWPLAVFWLADGYSLLGRHEDAVNALDLALQINPLNARLWQQKAEVLLRARQTQAALSVALKAVELDPDLADAQGVLGLVYHDLGRNAEAEAAQRKAIELGSRKASPYVNLANLLRTRGQLDEAEALYRKALELEPDNAGALNSLGGVFFDRRQIAEAEKWYRKAFELEPENAHYSSSLGNALRFLGQLDQGEQLLRKAIELDPEHAVAHLNLGILYLQRRQWDQAEQLMLKAGELDPNLSVEQFLALLYQAQGKPEQAEQALRQWLARSPNDRVARNELAYHLAERGIKLDEALRLATQAADLAATNTSAVVYASVLDTLGWVYYRRGELDQAETWLKKAVELAGEGPASASKREHLKKVREAKGKPSPP
jgi:tetratricopeptide (TPR) repeat protein